MQQQKKLDYENHCHKNFSMSQNKIVFLKFKKKKGLCSFFPSKYQNNVFFGKAIILPFDAYNKYYDSWKKDFLGEIFLLLQSFLCSPLKQLVSATVQFKILD